MRHRAHLAAGNAPCALSSPPFSLTLSPSEHRAYGWRVTAGGSQAPAKPAAAAAAPASGGQVVPVPSKPVATAAVPAAAAAAAAAAPNPATGTADKVRLEASGAVGHLRC